MASWKKVLVSGSSIDVNQITASGVPTVDNESNLLALSTDGGITQITQGSIAGTNPTFTIDGINSSTTTTTNFTTTGSLIFSHSLDHGFGFTITDSGTTSSISLQTPQDLQTTASPTFEAMLIKSQIIHEADLDSKIQFDNDKIGLHAGGVEMLTLTEDGSQDKVVINEDGGDVDFTVKTGQTDPLFHIDAGTDQVFIGTGSSAYDSLLKVDGTIHTTGITASALPTNASSTTAIVDGGSGVFEKRDFAPIIQSTAGDYTASLSSSIIGTTNEVGVTTDGSGNIVIGLTDNVTIPSNLTVTNDLDLTGGNVNVIGDISASGNITASNIQVNNDIALGGNIFSFSGFSFIEGISANFTGSNVFGSGSTPGANDTAGGGTAHQFTGSVAITGSALTITDGDLSLDEGSITTTNGSITAINGTGSFNSVYGISSISSSGHLFASLSNDDSSATDAVVVYDNATGQFFTTQSAGVGVTDYSNLTGIPTAIVSESVITSTAQGQITHEVNDNTTNIDLGLQTGDSPTFMSMSLNSNLEVNGNLTLGTSSAAFHTIQGPITASGAISGSSHLFASLSLNNGDFNTVMYDASTGQFFHTGSYGGSGISFDQITGLPDDLVSGSSFSSTAQGTLSASINGNVTIVDLGLDASDSPTFAGLTTTGDVQLGNQSSDTVTIAGNLIVNGTQTTISTSDLSIEDKYILLASGAATDTSAGIIVERTAGGTGTALFWDSTSDMWSIDTAGADGPGDTATGDLKIVTVGQASTIPSQPGSAAGGNYGNSEANQQGQLFVDTSDEFGLYVYL